MIPEQVSEEKKAECISFKMFRIVRIVSKGLPQNVWGWGGGVGEGWGEGVIGG